MLIGKFLEKLFNIDTNKVFKNKCKLFRYMKDILDFHILKLIDYINEKIDERIFNIIQTMQVFGIHSHGKNILFIFFII
jgi:hypothetical protein